ncbi:FecR domain-containing protein [Pyxidicoccus parkwayensis]|uniref:FecR domain-containing protein n=1 Tax=Pyxidicoccus parkwayensis TaxID=2813578 RepID=A0ABX7PAX0_9BACT|nr:FecR domain-containing protein [Pyxidicoccus parkwaysis]QSQ27668.1 FecR domain-containing protein [Pyxidicoccus parkwaysis]
MTEQHQRWAEAARSLDPQYSTDEATLFEAEVRRRYRQRAVRRRVVLAGLGVAALLLVGLFVPSKPRGPGVPEVAIGEDARVVMPIGTPVRTLRSEQGLLWLEVERGAVRFSVAPQHGRLVRVSAGAVDVEVVGTAFSVTRGDKQVSVVVTEGRVRVRAGARETLLAAGEQGTFRVEALAPEAASAPARPGEVVAEASGDGGVPAMPGAPSVAPAPQPPGRKSVRRLATWRALAEQGDFQTAWSAMQREGAPDDEPGDLLRAADVARLSGHPEAALAPLRRVLSRFRGDPRASLAAFTLGRVLLDDLGNPREAADAFLDAYALAPKGPLAPDALARAVEAQAQAGDAAAARGTAERFVEEFPQSRRVDAVRQWGRLGAQ